MSAIQPLQSGRITRKVNEGDGHSVSQCLGTSRRAQLQWAPYWTHLGLVELEAVLSKTAGMLKSAVLCSFCTSSFILGIVWFLISISVARMKNLWLCILTSGIETRERTKWRDEVPFPNHGLSIIGTYCVRDSVSIADTCVPSVVYKGRTCVLPFSSDISPPILIRNCIDCTVKVIKLQLRLGRRRVSNTIENRG